MNRPLHQRDLDALHNPIEREPIAPVLMTEPTAIAWMLLIWVVTVIALENL